MTFAGMRGSTPLDVAAASCIDNNELALALQEQDLEMVRGKLSHRDTQLFDLDLVINNVCLWCRL